VCFLSGVYSKGLQWYYAVRSNDEFDMQGIYTSTFWVSSRILTLGTRVVLHRLKHASS
jgi:hypothetical protein